jgi:hypothetical protein
MFIEDYGLSFTVWRIDDHANGNGLQKVGTAWKHPIVQVSSGKGSTPPNSTKLISTISMEELEAACTEDAWGWILIKRAAEGLRILVPSLASISHGYLLLILNSDKMTVLSDIKIANLLEQAILKEYGKPECLELEEDDEHRLRNLYYDKFGIELP